MEFSFNLAPEDAIKFFDNKKIVTQEQLNNIIGLNKAKAFHLANYNNLKVLQDVKNRLSDALKNGTTFQTFQKDLAKTVQEGTFTKRRLNTVFRTNVNSAYQAGRYKNLTANVNNRPYWMYVGIMDDRIRPSHASAHGKVFRYDHPFWAHFYPPNGFNCRCSVTALSEKDLKRRGLSVEDEADANIRHSQTQDSPKDGKYTYRNDKTGTRLTPDAGFDYPAQLALYAPKLDLFDEKLARTYIQRELNGATFAFVYNDIVKKLEQVSKKDWKKSAVEIRNNIAIQGSFASGFLTKKQQVQLGSEARTIWLSDDTLIKNIMHHPDLGIANYQLLPLLFSKIDFTKNLPTLNNNKKYKVTYGGENYILTFKVVGEKEIFLLSVFIKK